MAATCKFRDRAIMQITRREEDSDRSQESNLRIVVSCSCITIMPTFSFCGLKKEVRSVLLEKLYLYIEEEFDLELVKYTYLSMEIYF